MQTILTWLASEQGTVTGWEEVLIYAAFAMCVVLGFLIGFLVMYERQRNSARWLFDTKLTELLLPFIDRENPDKPNCFTISNQYENGFKEGIRFDKRLVVLGTPPGKAKLIQVRGRFEEDAGELRIAKIFPVPGGWTFISGPRVAGAFVKISGSFIVTNDGGKLLLIEKVKGQNGCNEVLYYASPSQLLLVKDIYSGKTTTYGVDEYGSIYAPPKELVAEARKIRRELQTT